MMVGKVTSIENVQPTSVLKGEGGEDQFVILKAEDFYDLRDAAQLTKDMALHDDGDFLPLELLDQIDAGIHPLRVIREYRGISQTDLADRVGVTRANISAIERGKVKPSAENLANLANALDVAMEDLLAPAD